jgi:steroid delta-isomerase-like uncharacterized protein
MSTEENKALVRRWFAAFSSGDVAAVDDLYAADVVDHSPAVPNQAPGRAGIKQIVTSFRAAYPDLAFTVEDLIADGDKVASRWTARGTNTGAFMGMPATGKQVTIAGILIVRVTGGKMVESWVNFDALGMLQQLGVVPAPGQAGT